MMTGSVCLAAAAKGASVAWVVPTYKNARPVWRFVEQHAARIGQVNKSELTARFSSGGWIGVYTADNDVSMRGEAFDIVAVDEAAQIKPDTYTDVIMPTVADRDGIIYLISTPKGKNWFYQEFMRGRADGKMQASFTAPSAANPIPQIQRAAKLARERVSERTYRQEWMAEFVDDGTLFVNVDKCATLAPAAYKQGHQYTIGVDWARASGGDWTVFTVLDVTEKGMAHITRMNGKAFEYQLDRLKELWASYNYPVIIAEYNSLGGPLVESLQTAGLPVTGFTTTAASKHEIITGLELAFDRQEIKVIDDPDLIVELNAYEKKERSGLPSYSAPDGFHDDTVISLALAWHHAFGGNHWVMS